MQDSQYYRSLGSKCNLRFSLELCKTRNLQNMKQLFLGLVNHLYIYHLLAWNCQHQAVSAAQTLVLGKVVARHICSWLITHFVDGVCLDKVHPMNRTVSPICLMGWKLAGGGGLHQRAFLGQSSYFWAQSHERAISSARIVCSYADGLNF